MGVGKAPDWVPQWMALMEMAGVPQGTFKTTIVNGDGTPLDPLTCDKWALPDRLALCDCPAKKMEGLEHSDSCNWTPIYASLVPSGYQMVLGSFYAATATLTQTVIKCAECGREMLGRDADVIYKAPEVTDSPQDVARLSRRPENIVKAVCPRHNTKGRIGYQRPAWAGY